MIIRFRTAFLCAALAFVLLFGARFASLVWAARGGDVSSVGFGSSDPFENSRKNYASTKKEVHGQALGDTQKFEKIGTLTATSGAFDADRQRILDQIAADGAVIQLERAQGLTGERSLNLGIGVPPAAFDGFIEKARRIGKLMQLAVVKNDKTNEYLQLRAKRATLEKTRAALEKLQQPDNKIDEKLHILNRLTDIEQQIQDLGVSLGDYDAANELCTVKLSLVERVVTRRSLTPRQLLRFAVLAFEWTVPLYLLAAVGLLALACAVWIVPIAWVKLSALAKTAGPS